MTNLQTNEPASSKVNYDCKVENKSNVIRELTISVKPDSIQSYLDRQFKALQRKAKIDGFRPGKVPMELVKKRFMGDAKSDVVSKLIQDAYVMALEENKLRAVGSPQIEAKSGFDLNDGETLTFTARIEIFPEITLNDLTKIKVKRKASKVDEKDVEQQLESLRKSNAELLPDEDRTGPAKDGDVTVISFTGTVDGKARDDMKGDNRMARIGSRTYMVDFENALIGMKKGETKSFPVVFPEDHPDKGLAGKTAQFEATLHEFKKEILPELDDEFAKRFKLESAADLRKKVADSLKEDRENESKNTLKNSLMEEILKANPFDVPNHFVLTQMEYLMRENAQFLTSRGFTSKMVEEYLQKNTDDLKKRAEDQVRFTLVLDKIAQDQGMKVEQADLDREFAKISEREGVPIERVTEVFAESEARSQLRMRIKEERTLEYILSQVKISEEK